MNGTVRVATAFAAMVLALGAAAQTPEQTKSVEEGQKQAADQLRPKLPWKLDAYTTMIDVTAEGVMLIYTYNVDTSKVTLSPNFVALAKESSVRAACKADNMEKLKSGAAYRHRYLDAQGTMRGSFEISISDCG